MREVTDWRVIVPIKQGHNVKSRLGLIMGDDARLNLAERMAAHVLSVLQTCSDNLFITILSPRRPNRWRGDWVRDEGRGLNPELTAWHATQGDAPILIIHADLPLLTADDVWAMMDAAGQGCALATDRAGTGTNALAIADGRPIAFSFGVNSCALHCAQYQEMAVLQRVGLIADLDTPDDAQFIAARGFAI
jgi:2-phospho-L-lactate/phosphoenolpyruvate guanylyltransferase